MYINLAAYENLHNMSALKYWLNIYKIFYFSSKFVIA